MNDDLLHSILRMNPNSECLFHWHFIEEWNDCFYQLRTDSNKNTDPDNLDLLDEDYEDDHGHQMSWSLESGEILYNSNGEIVYDGNQDILYEDGFETKNKTTFKSKTLIKLIQERLQSLLESDEIDLDYPEEFLESLDIIASPDSVMELFQTLGCKDFTLMESTEVHDKYLWFASSSLEGEYVNWSLEEVD